MHYADTPHPDWKSFKNTGTSAGLVGMNID